MASMMCRIEKCFVDSKLAAAGKEMPASTAHSVYMRVLCQCDVSQHL